MLKFKNSHKLPALVLKIFFLGAVNSFALWSVPILISNNSYVYAAYVAISTLVLDYIFLSKRFIAAKYIVPGAVLMVAFQIYPAIYTGYVAFTNFSVGHEFDKETAIDSMISNSYAPVGDDSLLPMRVARNGSGATVILIKENNGTVYVGTKTGIQALPASAVTLNAEGIIESADGYTVLGEDEVSQILDQFNNFNIPSNEANVIYRVYDFTNVERLKASLRYDRAGDFVQNLETGEIYRPDEYGSFRSESGEEIEPGWTVRVGWKNFNRIFGDERYRAPLIKVLTWTFIYPFLVVLMTFFLGLFLALALNHPRLRPKNRRSTDATQYLRTPAREVCFRLRISLFEVKWLVGARLGVWPDFARFQSTTHCVVHRMPTKHSVHLQSTFERNSFRKEGPQDSAS